VLSRERENKGEETQGKAQSPATAATWISAFAETDEISGVELALNAQNHPE
jgi:hypothetical protein